MRVYFFSMLALSSGRKLQVQGASSKPVNPYYRHSAANQFRKNVPYFGGLKTLVEFFFLDDMGNVTDLKRTA